MELTDKQKEIVSKAYDYIVRVTEKQERLLGFDDLYYCYRSVFKIENQLTEKGFKMLYDEIKNVINEKE